MKDTDHRFLRHARRTSARRRMNSMARRWKWLRRRDRRRPHRSDGASRLGRRYLPQPFTLVGGMAAVTKNIRFILGAVLLPLHDPVHFKGLTDPKVLRQAGLFAAWTPDELIAHALASTRATSASSHCWAVFRRRKGGRPRASQERDATPEGRHRGNGIADGSGQQLGSRTVHSAPSASRCGR